MSWYSGRKLLWIRQGGLLLMVTVWIMVTQEEARLPPFDKAEIRELVDLWATIETKMEEVK